MDNTIEIVSIANCGLLIKSPQAKILIDGIYLLGEKSADAGAGSDIYMADDLFTPIPEDILSRIITGSEEFQDLDCLLFTHYHPDHFSGVKILEFLKNYRKGSIFLPHDQTAGSLIVKKEAQKYGINVVDLDLPCDVKEEKTIKDIRIQYFKAPHSGGEEYSATEHYCFLLKIGDKSIYISGDADYTNSYQQTMLMGEDVTVAFFNPLHFHVQTGRELIRQINPRRVIMYHAPLEKDDKSGFRRISQRVVDKFRDSLPPCEIVSEVMQTFFI
jgi:L-ascorbate metabolism protein UlaG (beta-lactamase superfamily)